MNTLITPLKRLEQGVAPYVRCERATPWFDSIIAAEKAYDHAEIDRLTNERPVITFFSSTVKRAYLLIPVSGYWMLHCMSDQPTFETRRVPIGYISNYFDETWEQTAFVSEFDFCQAFVQYSLQPGSSEFPCTYDLTKTLSEFVRESVERPHSLYQSTHWRGMLKREMDTGHPYYGRRLGEITLDELTKNVPLMSLPHIGDKLLNALLCDIRRERLPWPWKRE